MSPPASERGPLAADPFHIRSHVPDFDAIVADIVQRSAAARQDIPFASDVRYGDDPAETLDIFFPQGTGKGLPVHMFIHGGYWRMFSKRDYSYMARAITDAGAIAVILDYALMPAVRMDLLVDQVRRAGRWVVGEIGRYGGDPERFSISGHSAGAHLATFLLHRDRQRPGAKSALLLGGLYDLKPLQGSFLQNEIALTNAEVERFSPLSQDYDPECQVIVAVGERETPPFHDQAMQFVARIREQGSDVRSVSLADENHMTSVRNLGTPGHASSSIIDVAIGLAE